MKYIPKIFSFFLLMSPVLCFAQQNTFTISGTVNRPEIKNLYFTQSTFYNTNTKPNAQKIEVLDGKFSFKGMIDEPVPAFLSLAEDYKKIGTKPKEFILDKGIISIEITSDLASAVVKGSKAQDDLFQYNIEQTPYSTKINEINIEAQRLSSSGISADSIAQLFRIPFRDANRALSDFQLKFVQKNSSAFISLLLIPNIARSTNNYIEADSLLASLQDNIESSATAKTIREYIISQKKTSVGALAPDFRLADTAGKKIALSALKGKYVLLDFWAAWCGPCRQENPNVVQAFKTYKNDGFTVFGVSLDKEKKSWLKAIHDDNLQWQHVSDLKFWASEAAILYGITSIPRNFLLDPRGKIIGRDLRGQDLLDKLEELFPAKKIK
jgi:peroxiredoxin